MSILQYALWLLPAALLIAIGYKVCVRRLYRDYPLFSAYIFAHLARLLILFYCYRLGIRETYRHVYLYAEIVDAALKFGVIFELCSHVFRSYEGIRSAVSTVLRGASLILLLAAVGVAAASASYDSDVFLSRFFAMERSLEIVQGGLLFLLFLLASVLSLRWNALPLGFAVGWGVVTSVNLAAFTLRAQLGVSSREVLSLISSAGYNCALLTWIVTLYAHVPVRQPVRGAPSPDVESWNRALVDFLRR
jgi:hypothetical protein